MNCKRYLSAGQSMALVLGAALTLIPRSSAQEFETKIDDPHFEKFRIIKAPVYESPMLRKQERLAICGDSITEQRMYSRIIETYLTVCTPELEISVRQFGWSGERAPGFLARMTNDVLRFQPTLATTCYGMNDHEYRPYAPEVGAAYAEAMSGIVQAFRGARTRVVVGSPGCVGKVPAWCQAAGATVEDLNLSLAELRNIGIQIARKEQVRFADIFWPMFVADFEARKKHGDSFAVAGKDGVHPDWAGSLIMAFSFLDRVGLSGSLGAFTVDMKSGTASASPGHRLLGYQGGMLKVESVRYPFCACVGDVSLDDNIRAGMALVPFHQELNRLQLRIENPKAERYRVTWGPTSMVYSAMQLMDGVNLAEAFPVNPFCEAFGRVDLAVAAKQAYETKQVKSLFHGEEGRVDMESTVALTEKTRELLVKAIKDAFVPVTHTIEIVAE